MAARRHRRSQPSEILVPSAEMCVIHNPTAARGRAEARLEDLRRQFAGRAEFRPTAHPGHAEKIAYEAAREGFPIVAAAGGDGTVHEVACGVLRADGPETRFAVIPLGSANDYAYSLKRSRSVGDSSGERGWAVDVGHVRAEDGRESFFVNTLGLGFSASVTVESRRIRRLGGMALYGLAFLRALWRRYRLPRMEIALDDRQWRAPTLSFTVAIAHREGSFVVAPHALLDDGWFDYLLAGALPRWKVLRYLPKLAGGGELPKGDPAIVTGRCQHVELSADEPLTVHVDGEFFCLPEDRVRRLSIELLPRRLRVELIDDLGR
jgi:diacylglycerol kinase (ATP)